MDYRLLIEGQKRFGSSESDICLSTLGVKPDSIHENVILAPWWEPNGMPGLGEPMLVGAAATIKVWELDSKIGKLTYIKTGIGATQLMDVVLALGLTPCVNVIFIGSVGGLDLNIEIGDIVIPEFSICGDGASRYIASDNLKSGDVFGEKVYPDSKLYVKAAMAAEMLCENQTVNCHLGRNFSIDSIFAQFAHIDEIIAMGCNVIEMETACAMRAAKLAKIALAAIFIVSDNTLAGKSLVSGRTEEEAAYRKKVRQELMPAIVFETLK